MIDLTNTRYIESAVFIRWDIPGYATAYISDYHTDVTIDGNVYTNAGNLLSVGDISSELSASASELSIALSGVPAGDVTDVLAHDVKGSSIQIFRGFFDPNTHALLDLSPEDNPTLKFKGIVTNYSISDDIDIGSGVATTTISLACNSIVEVLSNKVTGRRTNQVDFADESSMDRVLPLTKSNYQFGAPQ